MKYRFKDDCVPEGIYHPVLYGVVYKRRRAKKEANFISPVSKIITRLRRRQYDSVIFEKTKSCACSCTYKMYLSKNDTLWLTRPWGPYKHRFIIYFYNHIMFPLVLSPPPHLRKCIALYAVAEGWLLLDILSCSYMTDIVSSKETGHGSSNFLIVSRDSFSLVDLLLLTDWVDHSLLWPMSLDISEALFYHLRCLCTDFYYLSALVGCCSSVSFFFSVRNIIYTYKMRVLLDTGLLREGCARKPVNHISRDAVVIPTDRP